VKINDALKLRLPRIRKGIWVNPNTYIRLPLLENGGLGAWAELYDDAIQKDVLHIIPGSQKFCILLPDVTEEDGYEEYTGPISPYEADNFAKGYAEA